MSDHVYIQLLRPYRALKIGEVYRARDMDNTTYNKQFWGTIPPGLGYFKSAFRELSKLEVLIYIGKGGRVRNLK